VAKLVFHSGAYQGKRVTLPPGKSITLGRNRDIDLPLPDPKLSRKHCQIVSRTDQFIVRDLNSTNGTFVNGTRLSGEYQLKPFDRIVLGDIELEFLDEAAARITPDAARTAVGNPAVATTPSRAQPAVAMPARGMIESSDLLEDLVDDSPAAPAAAQGNERVEQVEEVEEVVAVVAEAGDLLEEVSAPVAASAQAGEIIEDEIQLEEIDPADQISVPVPARAISAPTSKSGRAAPGFLAPPAQAAPPPFEEVVEDTDPGATGSAQEQEDQQPADPLEEALYELSLPLPPEPPLIQQQDQRPKVLFCDGCDASIPLLQWDLNLAQARGGKVYCQQCLPTAGRSGANGGHATAPAARAPVAAGTRLASVTPMPPGHGAPASAFAPAARQHAPREKSISDILAGLDEEAVVVDTTVKRRGHVVQDEDISKQLQTMEDAQQKTGAAARPSHNVAGRGGRPAGFLGGNPAARPASAPSSGRAPQAAPAPAARPAAPPAKPTADADSLLDDFDEIT